jgi:hypothetical protein
MLAYHRRDAHRHPEAHMMIIDQAVFVIGFIAMLTIAIVLVTIQPLLLIPAFLINAIAVARFRNERL